MIREPNIGFVGNPGVLPRGSRENTGNIVHWHAARALFEQPGQIQVNMDDAYLESVRNSYTHLGIATATMLNVNNVPEFVAGHETWADFIEKLDLPVLVLGLGCQAPVGQSIANANVDPRSIRLLKTLSDRAISVGVRGEFTASLCEKYGVSNIRVIGCQSSYLAGLHNWDTKPVVSRPVGRVVSNLTSGADERALLQLVMKLKADIIGQGDGVEERIANGDISRDDYMNDVGPYWTPAYLKRLYDLGLLTRTDYFEYVKSHFFKFYTVPEWINFIRERYVFSFGTRFHGNMIAFQAGVPALWVVHDMRTHELCNYLGLPNISHDALQSIVGLDELVERCDYSNYWRLYPERLSRFLGYFEENGVGELLAHRFVERASSIIECSK